MVLCSEKKRNRWGVGATADESGLIKDSNAGGVSNCAGRAIAAIATATDGTTVMEELFENCGMSLPLPVGNDYVINFVDEDNEFVATMASDEGSILHVYLDPDDTDIDLGTIEIADGVATCSNTVLVVLYTCATFNLADSDGDGICDLWDDSVPEASDMPSTGSDEDLCDKPGECEDPCVYDPTECSDDSGGEEIEEEEDNDDDYNYDDVDECDDGYDDAYGDQCTW